MGGDAASIAYWLRYLGSFHNTVTWTSFTLSLFIIFDSDFLNAEFVFIQEFGATVYNVLDSFKIPKDVNYPA